MSGKVIPGSELLHDSTVRADVVVVGSGAGGSIAAATLAARGASVVVLEEGGSYSASDFDMREETAYPEMYQDAGSRATDDLSIIILQGRCVGGGTTVNWMTSLRTPEATLERWERGHAVTGMSNASLSPHYDAIEARLNIHRAAIADVNANNRVLLEGATRLGYATSLLPRNSVDCTNLGYCGMGCPTDAKQSATLTYLDDLLRHNGTIYSDCRALNVVRRGQRAIAVEAVMIGRESHQPNGRTLRVEADRVILSGGAINTPLLLLRSGMDDGKVGRRTWLHPVVATIGEFEERIDPWYGSPQSVSSDEFWDRGAKMGFFIETPPIHPMLGAMALPLFGAGHRELMSKLAHVNALIGLTIDGFDESERGGTVTLGKNSRLRFSYDLGQRNEEALVAAMKAMARIQLAAGAKRVLTLHRQPIEMMREADIDRIDEAAIGPNLLSLFTAHQMGGCAMGEDHSRSVVDSRGKHHQFDNLYVCDGSLFPTSLGVNPMLTIYAVSSLIASDM